MRAPSDTNRCLIIAVAAVLALAALAPSAPGSSQAPATRIVPLPEVEMPRQIRAEGGRVYIVDKKDLIVYDFETGRLLRRIGKPGQGPGEFTMGPNGVTVLPDRLVLTDIRKILFFSSDGAYLGQVMEPGFMGIYPYLPVGGRFVGFPRERREDGIGPPVGCIFDSAGKRLKQFYGEMPGGPPPPPPPGAAASGPKRDVALIDDYADYQLYDDRIYVADSRNGLSIAVFDSDGEPLYEIKHERRKIKVPGGYRDGFLKSLDRQHSRYWDNNNPVVPEFFPAFVGFRIDAGRIYVITPDQKDGLYEVIVMDLKGRILETAYRFPMKPNFQIPQAFALQYDIENNKFVWCAYDEAKETYELHMR